VPGRGQSRMSSPSAQTNSPQTHRCKLAVDPRPGELPNGGNPHYQRGTRMATLRNPGMGYCRPMGGSRRIYWTVSRKSWPRRQRLPRRRGGQRYLCHQHQPHPCGRIRRLPLLPINPLSLAVRPGIEFAKSSRSCTGAGVSSHAGARRRFELFEAAPRRSRETHEGTKRRRTKH
jgi:hypothetical protein